MLVFVQTPVGATANRTNAVLDKVQDHFLDSEKQAGRLGVHGAGLQLQRHRTERRHRLRAAQGLGRAQVAQTRASRRSPGAPGAPFSQIKDALVYPIVPPAVTELGTSAGLRFLSEGRQRPRPRGADRGAQPAARHGLEGQAADRRAPERLGGFAAVPARHRRRSAPARSACRWTQVNETLALAWGGRYIDDFIDRGKRQARVRPGRCAVSHEARGLQPLVRAQQCRQDGAGVRVLAARTGNTARRELERFNGVSAVEINGEAAPGVSSGRGDEGDARSSSAKLPPGYSRRLDRPVLPGARRRRADADAVHAVADRRVPVRSPRCTRAGSCRSRSCWRCRWASSARCSRRRLRGLERDIYFQVGMLTTIGLASKNAILIVEFAKLNVDAGHEA